MKRTIFLVVLMVTLVSAGTAAAGKIGFVDLEKVVGMVDEGKAEIKLLDAWAISASAEIQKLKVEYQKLKEQAERQTAVATAESVELMQAEETTLRRKLEDKSRDFERNQQEKTQAFLKKVGSKVSQVTKDYGKTNGYDVIFILREQPFAYLADEADVTNIIIGVYNERFPVK